jgi:hypothetical protein
VTSRRGKQGCALRSYLVSGFSVQVSGHCVSHRNLKAFLNNYFYTGFGAQIKPFGPKTDTRNLTPDTLEFDDSSEKPAIETRKPEPLNLYNFS